VLLASTVVGTIVEPVLRARSRRVTRGAVILAQLRGIAQ
jgi:hypothetical protein